jgi:hypothetical protein
VIAFRLALSFLVCAACSSALPEPLPIRQHPRAYQQVPYPPPAAFVELIPEKPDDRALWVDGHWSFQGKRYYWRRGGWVIPQPDSRYANCRIRYGSDGTISFAEAGFYDAQGNKLPDPPIVRPATTPPNEITAEEEHSGR